MSGTLQLSRCLEVSVHVSLQCCSQKSFTCTIPECDCVPLEDRLSVRNEWAHHGVAADWAGT